MQNWPNGEAVRGTRCDKNKNDPESTLVFFSRELAGVTGLVFKAIRGGDGFTLSVKIDAAPRLATGR